PGDEHNSSDGYDPLDHDLSCVMPALSARASTSCFLMPRAPRSPPTGFLFWWIHRHFGNEAVPVRHFDLRQTLVVHHVGLRNDAVPKQQKCGQRVNFVRGQRSRLRDGHRAVDIVPRDRRIWVVGDAVPVLSFERAAERLAGITQYQTSEDAAFTILAVADLAPLRKDHRTFL